MNGHVPRFILATALGGTLFGLGAGPAAADPEPSPVGPTPPASEDPPPPPPPPGLLGAGFTQSGWDLFFPKCWPPWEPPGAPAPPPGDPSVNIWTDVE